MAAPATTDEFLDLIRKSGVAEEKRFDAWLQKTKAAGLPAKPGEAAGLLVRDGVLTTFQAEQILQGKWKRFTIGKYKVLEKLGSGGMGSVYLCEHKLMRRRVAIKVLPTAKAQDESALQRFYREARAVAALDHPNIVHAYDIDQDESLHFLVMEYVDGASLQDIVKKAGPMEIARACHYIRQSTLGLEHANQAGLIHRDIKPGNILVERTGVVKILDMGLARFFNDEDDVLTKKFDENVLGTADYLAPEQAIDSHTVDVRADIYSLGATFYYMLTGRTCFGEGTVAQKLIWHQNRQPKPVTEFRPEVPPELAAIIAKMMAKDVALRYQTPAEVAEALEPFTREAVGPPPDTEMPHLSPAAVGPGAPLESADTAIVKNSPVSPAPRALQGMSSKANMKAPSAPVAPPSRVPAPPSGPVRVAAVSAPVSPAPRSAPTAPGAVSTTPAPAFTLTETATPAAEEEAPWESLSSVDTQDPSAHADTAPQGSKSSRSFRALTKKAPVKNPRRAWFVLSTIAAGSLFVVTGLLVYAFIKTPATTVAARKPLQVTKDAAGPNEFKTIFNALQNARPGDVIELVNAEHRENLALEHRITNITTDVTIQAAPGKEVVWKSASRDEHHPILKLQKVRDFKIKGKGLQFDGTIDDKKRVKDLIVINFESPGVAIEDVTFQNFGRSAIDVSNAMGSHKKPIRLGNLTTLAAPQDPQGAALLFEVVPNAVPTQNGFIVVGDDCHFFRGNNDIKLMDNAVNDPTVKLPK